MSDRKAIDDINYIKQIIEDSKNTVIENGIGYIIWGVIVSVGLLTTYFSILFRVHLPHLIIWSVLIGGGWIFTAFDTKKEKRTRKSHTFADKILGALWLSAGVAMTILGFAGTISGAYSGVHIPSVLSVVLGIAYFVSGGLYDDKMVRYLAFGWWIGVIVMFFLGSYHNLLIMAIMMIFLQILPGISFYNKFKKAQSVSA